MSADSDVAPLDADAVDGFRSARETAAMAATGDAAILGHDGVAADFGESLAADRLHHAWLLRGPRGVGKATLALRLAIDVLARDEPAADAIGLAARATRLGAHPRLFELGRAWNEKTKKFKTGVAVDDARRLTRFFGLSAADGGWRVAVVDAADTLTREAANALLKVVEEPPPRALFLIIAHGETPPPPTLRSRCRVARFRALTADEARRALTAARTGAEASAAATEEALSLSAASGADASRYSPGAAARVEAAGAPALQSQLLGLFRALPRRDAAGLDKLAQSVSRASGADRFDVVSRLLPRLMERLARAGAIGADAAGLDQAEASLAARLSPTMRQARFWAEQAAATRAVLRQASALNLDPGRVLLDIFLGLEEEAARRAI